MASVFDLGEGSEVLVYKKIKNKIDPDSLREGHVVDFHKTYIRIKFEAFEAQYEGSLQVCMFFIDDEKENFKRRYGDTGMPEEVYFATMDEELEI